MNYIVTINGKAYEVCVEKAPTGFRTEGMTATPVAAMPAPIRPVAPAPVAPATNSAVAVAPAPVAPPPTPAPVATPATVPAGVGRIESPLPGTLLDVKVAKGDTVKKNQVLFVIEAMKMENEIVSPVDGVVSSIHVQKGDMLAPQALMAVIQ